MPAVTTAFRDDYSLDEDSYTANVDRLLDAGATGVVAAGCTGEFWALSFAERLRLTELTVASCKGRGTSIVGTGAVTESEVIEQIDAARGAGADGALVLPPYFAHLTKSEIIAHFEAVSDKATLPVVLYNIPGNAGNAITPDIADILADLDNVVAIKESSGDWGNFHRTLAAVKDRIRVFCGPSSTLGVAASLAGADGHIDCFPNVWTDCMQIWHATAAGRIDDAWALQRTGIAMTDLYTANGRTLYPATKAVMNANRLPGAGALRPPLRPLSGTSLEELLSGMEQLVAPKQRVARGTQKIFKE
ncbi:dihydrodipicolinate synthase family protein [Loktanella sp. SALINAS62]|uniref:dihydrodipicolinate synthase family protein n=1 Tax=Loktanella sp. SALINAS62 TaxID=2706124 RepID=UPI001B8B8BEB|nr:dihydrodipicolinate synthase family protein [Loktanella sp. SALINAS62]MBS1301495.1 dihydrodipicolinate synthase family protein [Loktanella sp. SALINAS62]